MIRFSLCHSRRQIQTRRTRRGAIMIVVLMGLLLIGLISASLFKLSFAQRNQALREQIRLQCDWLAEAGCDRAATRWSSDSAYRGETWELPAEVIGGQDAGIVEIELQRDPGATGRWLVKAAATYPQDSVDRARITRRIAFVEDVQ